jgi:hypothetical protein
MLVGVWKSKSPSTPRKVALSAYWPFGRSFAGSYCSEKS